jgi:hypothetical protein
MDMVDIAPVITIGVDDAAREREMRARMARSFIVGEESMLSGGRIEVQPEFEAKWNGSFVFESWESNAIEVKRTQDVGR